MARDKSKAGSGPPSIPQPPPNQAWSRRQRASQKHRPKRIRLLLVAESPPPDLSRYFYFDEAGSEDVLFEQVCEVLFEEKPSTGDKSAYLGPLRRRGVYTVELKPDAPRQDEKLEPYVPWLALSLDPLAPEHVVLVGDAYEAAREKLTDSGFRVVDVKVPAPSAGSETPFRQELRKALVRAGLEKLIKPLPRSARAGLEQGPNAPAAESDATT